MAQSNDKKDKVLRHSSIVAIFVAISIVFGFFGRRFYIIDIIFLICNLIFISGVKKNKVSYMTPFKIILIFYAIFEFIVLFMSILGLFTSTMVTFISLSDNSGEATETLGVIFIYALTAFISFYVIYLCIIVNDYVKEVKNTKKAMRLEAAQSAK